MRGAIASASSAGRPDQDLLEAAIERRRHEGLAERVPASTSSVTSRSPSTRLNGPMTIRLISASSRREPAAIRAVRARILAHAPWRRRFRQRGERDEPGLGHVERQADRNAREFRRLEKAARRLETGRRAGDAGRAGLGAGAAAVPGPLVAIADRLRRLATEILHQASAFGKMLGARLEFVKLVAAASVMREMIREKSRPPETVHVGAVEDAQRQGQQCLHDPAGMRRAAGDIDDRQSGARDIIGAERAARIAAEILQAARVGRIGRGGGNAAKSRARADGDAITGARRERCNPVEHATPGPGEPVEKSRAIGSMQHRALDAQRVKRQVSALDLREDRSRFRPGFLGLRLDATTNLRQMRAIPRTSRMRPVPEWTSCIRRNRRPVTRAH